MTNKINLHLLYYSFAYETREENFHMISKFGKKSFSNVYVLWMGVKVSQSSRTNNINVYLVKLILHFSKNSN